MIPSVGRIVHYKLTEANAKYINDSRDGNPALQGNKVTEGEVYPMIITRLWTDNPDHQSAVQGQVFLDGNDTLWVTSAQQGAEQFGHWFQPVHV